MSTFFFTHGSDNGGGWTEVTAENMDQAIDMYSMVHPRSYGLVSCCSIYTEETFKQTSMYADSNFGKRCVERISLNRTIVKEETNHADGSDEVQSR